MKTAELKVLPVAVLKPAEYNPRKKLKANDSVKYKAVGGTVREATQKDFDVF